MISEKFLTALDVGGSSIKSGVVSLTRGEVVGAVRRTPLECSAPAEVLLKILADCVRETAAAAGADGPSVGVALAFPGPFDYAKGIAWHRGVAKFDHLHGIDVGAELAIRTGLPREHIRFMNDAAAAVAGEACFGAGQGEQRVIGITLGTGFGSCFALEGQPQVTGPGVPEGGELYAELWQGRMADEWFSIRGLLARATEAGLRGLQTPADVAARAAAGDALAREVWAAFGRDIGAFLRPYAEQFGASRIMVGGGLGAAWPYFGASLGAAVGVDARQILLGEKAPLLGLVRLFL